jgi:hypothetical protein
MGKINTTKSNMLSFFKKSQNSPFENQFVSSQHSFIFIEKSIHAISKKMVRNLGITFSP